MCLLHFIHLIHSCFLFADVIKLQDAIEQKRIQFYRGKYGQLIPGEFQLLWNDEWVIGTFFKCSGMLILKKWAKKEIILFLDQFRLLFHCWLHCYIVLHHIPLKKCEFFIIVWNKIRKTLFCFIALKLLNFDQNINFHTISRL